MNIIEHHRDMNENRKFYRRLNEGRKPFQQKNNMCRDLRVDGTLLSDIKSIVRRWRNHFNSLLNKEPETEQTMLHLGRGNGLDDLEPPDEDEIIVAIERLKNNKAPGFDNLPAELFDNCSRC